MIKKKIFKPKLSLEGYSKPNVTNLAPSIIPYETFKKNNKFEFLNIEYSMGKNVDWNYSGHGKLWTYNLNYFEFLLQDNCTEKEGLDLILDFIRKKEIIKDGLEPFPTSLRILNWIKFLTKYDIESEKINQSLFSQVKLLERNIEYHLLGNHLLENGFAILFASIYFNNVSFFKTAKGILVEQLNCQVLEDGGHFELSPMYHQHILFRVLDNVNFIKNKESIAGELLPLLLKISEKMLNWLNEITFKNGEIPLLNDSARKIAPTSSQLVGYASRLGINTNGKILLKESGYRKLKGKDYELLIDVGDIGPDYIPGHAHSDTLNFVLHLGKSPFIVDTGTSTYEIGALRTLERSTSAHNTVMIGNIEQSECWAGFRVARRAYSRILQESENKIIATHTGYDRIKSNHTRTWFVRGNGIEITDRVISGKMKENKAFLHFHPTVEILEIGRKSIKTNLSEIAIEGATNLIVEDYNYAPEFNQRIRSKKAIIHFKEYLRTTISL